MTEDGREPRTEMLSATPALPVKDMTRSVAFYRDVLGFGVVHEEAAYAVLRRDAAGIYLWASTDESWRERGGSRPIVSGAESFLAGTASCRVAVTHVDALHAVLEPQGILHPNGSLREQPWGSREFAVLDPDDNLITFYEAQ